MATIPNACIIPAMSSEQIEKVSELEAITSTMPQAKISTYHIIHGGMYSRSVMIQAGMIITGALIKVPTTLIVSGDTTVFIGEDTIRLTGYNVMAASAGRKQAFFAHADTHLTMTFQTEAKTVVEAEEEFTDDFERLLSRHQDNQIIITGE